MQVQIQPGDATATVKSVEKHQETVARGIPGDVVGFSLRGVARDALHPGMVCSLADHQPLQPCSSFKAQVAVIDGSVPLKPGSCVTLQVHTAQVPCKLSSISSHVDKSGAEVAVESSTAKADDVDSGAKDASGSRRLKAGDKLVMDFIPLSPVCVEAFKQTPTLGRFILSVSKRQDESKLHRTVVHGRVLSVNHISAAEVS